MNIKGYFLSLSWHLFFFFWLLKIHFKALIIACGEVHSRVTFRIRFLCLQSGNNLNRNFLKFLKISPQKQKHELIIKGESKVKVTVLQVHPIRPSHSCMNVLECHEGISLSLKDKGPYICELSDISGTP